MDWVTAEYDMVEQFQVGVTYEGRTMNALKISKDPSANRTAIYVDALIHCREWITSAAVLWTFNQVRGNSGLTGVVTLWHCLKLATVNISSCKQ